MKKIINYIGLFIFSFMICINLVWASSFDVTVTSNSVTVGNSVTLKVKVTDAAGKFTISSSNSSVVSVGSNTNTWIDNQTQSFTLKANKVGTAKITIVADDVTDYDGKTLSGSKTITITVKEKTTTNNNSSNKNNNSGSSNSSNKKTQAPKSSNNLLSSLTIDGLELDKKFDKETLEYSVIVPVDTEKIKINAQLADSTAKITGVGEVKLTAGLNTFEIVVTAENGSKRTYVLKATLLEAQPIKVVVDDCEYTIVRKRKDLPEISEYFTEKEITIGSDKIEGYYNDTLKYDLVGLKDSKGLIEYYIYKDNKYKLYKEYAFNGMVVQVIDKELTGGYKKTSFVYGSDKINSYQEVSLDLIKNTYALDNNEISGNQFYLFYGINVENGREYLYQYDALEKTVQRYNTKVLDMYKEQADTYYMVVLGCILGLGIVIILFSIILIKMGNKNKKLKRIDTKKRIIKEDRIINDDLEDIPLSDVSKKKKK